MPPDDCDQGRRPPTGDVPVFNLQFFIAPRGKDGFYVVRAASLPVIGRGRTEPEALRDVVGLVKVLLAEHLSAGLPIPWNESPEEPADDESERLLAIHL